MTTLRMPSPKAHELLKAAGGALATIIAGALVVLAASDPAWAQCRPVSERTGEVGCWIMAREPLGRLAQPAVFWHLDAYPTRREAEAAKAQAALGDIEAKMVDTPAEGLEGLVVKLGLHCFLNEHADAASAQSDSAYRDLVRLTGQNPAVEISRRFERTAA